MLSRILGAPQEMRITIKGGKRFAYFEPSDFPEPRLLDAEQRNLTCMLGTSQDTSLAHEFQQVHRLGFESCYLSKRVAIDRLTIKFREQKTAMRGDALLKAQITALFARHSFYITETDAINVAFIADTVDAFKDAPKTKELLTPTMRSLVSNLSVAILSQVSRTTTAPLPWLNHSADVHIDAARQLTNWYGHLPTPESILAFKLLLLGQTISAEDSERVHELFDKFGSPSVDAFVSTLMNTSSMNNVEAQNLWMLIESASTLEEASDWVENIPSDTLSLLMKV